MIAAQQSRPLHKSGQVIKHSDRSYDVMENGEYHRRHNIEEYAGTPMGIKDVKVVDPVSVEDGQAKMRWTDRIIFVIAVGMLAAFVVFLFN